MTEKFVEIQSLKNETLIERTTKLAKRERGFGSLWSFLRESRNVGGGSRERFGIHHPHEKPHLSPRLPFGVHGEEAKRERRYSASEEDQSASGFPSP